MSKPALLIHAYIIVVLSKIKSASIIEFVAAKEACLENPDKLF